MQPRPPLLLPDIDIGYLLNKYPHLKASIKNGHFDFTKSSNQYDITEAILHEYFGIDITLDRTKLCPRIPNRLEYLRICENLVAEIDPPGPEEWVIDIGTGSSLIFPLLGTNINGSKYIGTEIDSASLEHAHSIIAQNKLMSRIRVINPGSQSLLPCDKLVDIIGDEHVKYTICNPPFYKSRDDYLSHQNSKIKPSPLQLIISDSELYTDGGEYQFITKLILNSMELAHLPQFQNTWFTSMVGIYSNVKRLRTYVNALLNKGKLTNFAFAEIDFKTKRWVLVWNFCHWRPYCLRNTLPQLNRRDIVGIAVSGNYSPQKIASVLQNLFSRIKNKHAGFVYTLQIYRNSNQNKDNNSQGLHTRSYYQKNSTSSRCSQPVSSLAQFPSISISKTGTSSILSNNYIYPTNSTSCNSLSSSLGSGPILLVRTNAPVWNRSCRRKLLHFPDRMSFDNHVYISVSLTNIVLLCGTETHFKAFVFYVTSMSSEMSALMNI